jgi:hypothetical protein
MYDFAFPETDQDLRKKLEQLSIEDIIQYCNKNNITLPGDPKNRRRVIHVACRNGQPTSRQMVLSKHKHIVAIATDSRILRERITGRAHIIFSSGVVEEATIFGQQLRKLLIDYKPKLEEYIIDAETDPAHDAEVNPYNTVGVKLVSEMKNNVNVYNVSPILWDLPEEGLINYVHKLKPYTVVSDGINLGTINMVSRMSLSCDAQNQRHRTTTRYTPSILDGFAQYKNEILKLVKTEENDIAGIIDTKVFYTPELFKSVPEALELYARTMHDLYKFIYAEYIEISDIIAGKKGISSSDDKFLDELFLLLPNSIWRDYFRNSP